MTFCKPGALRGLFAGSCPTPKLSREGRREPPCSQASPCLNLSCSPRFFRTHCCVPPPALPRAWWRPCVPPVPGIQLTGGRAPAGL